MQEHVLEEPFRAGRGSLRQLPRPAAARPDDIDPEAMETLRDLVGEQRFGELLTCIADDLERVARSLSLAVDAPDPEAMRAQSHILIGLAVTIGAAELGEAGRRLNAAVRDAASDRAQAMLPAVIAGAGAVARRMILERDRLRPA